MLGFQRNLKKIILNNDRVILRDSWGVPHIYGTTDKDAAFALAYACLLYTSPSPRDGLLSRMPSSA